MGHSPAKWAAIAKCSTDTALRDIQPLLALVILLKEPAGGRSTSYRLAPGSLKPWRGPRVAAGGCQHPVW